MNENEIQQQLFQAIKGKLQGDASVADEIASAAGNKHRQRLSPDEG